MQHLIELILFCKQYSDVKKYHSLYIYIVFFRAPPFLYIILFIIYIVYKILLTLMCISHPSLPSLLMSPLLKGHTIITKLQFV